MNIEIAIDSSCLFIKKKGIEIVTDFWGIHLENDQWVSNNKMCCPLGAVLLDYQLVYPETPFTKGRMAHEDLMPVRYNPTYAIMNLFHVDLAWVKSFWHGLMDMQILYTKYPTVRELGYKYHQIYTSHDI